MHQTTVLVVDDDPSINDLLKTILEAEGWKTISAIDGDKAIKSFHENLPDIIILDINMPGIDGIEVCRHIANTSPSVPIVMLSALSDLANKVRCLGLGANDYITKPFQPEELIARLKAQLRHHHKENSIQERNLYTSDAFEIDFGTQRVRIQGNEVRLPPTEYRLLEELTKNVGKPLTYKYLLNKVWGPDYSTERQYLHVYIGRLRTKIESDPKNPKYIVSLPGIGYRFQTVRNEPSVTK